MPNRTIQPEAAADFGMLCVFCRQTPRQSRRLRELRTSAFRFSPPLQAQPAEKHIQGQLHANVEITELGIAGRHLIKAHLIHD